MAAPTTISERSPATASSVSYTDLSDGGNSTIHKMINLYPYFYKYSAGTSYQINPDFEVHYVQLDAPNADGGHTLNLTLPYIDAYPCSQCLMVVYLRSSHPGDFLTFTPVDAACSINSGADGAAYSFTTDSQDHLFFVYGAFRQASNGNYINKYFVKQIQGREITISAGTGIAIAPDNFNYTISAFTGSPIYFGITLTAVNTACYWGPNPNAAPLPGTDASYFKMPKNGVISNLSVIRGGTTSTASTAFTLAKEGVDTTVTCTVAADVTTASDNTNTFTVAAGDNVQLKTVQTGTADTKNCVICFYFRPTAL